MVVSGATDDIEMMETDPWHVAAIEDVGSPTVAQCQGGDLAIETVAHLSLRRLPEGRVEFTAHDEYTAGTARADIGVCHVKSGDHASAGIDEIEAARALHAELPADESTGGRFEDDGVRSIVFRDAGAQNEIDVVRLVPRECERAAGSCEAEVKGILAFSGSTAFMDPSDVLEIPARSVTTGREHLFGGDDFVRQADAETFDLAGVGQWHGVRRRCGPIEGADLYTMFISGERNLSSRLTHGPR